MTIDWRKSSHSSAVNDELCIELGRLPSGVAVRDSKNPDAGHLALSGRRFAQLTVQIKALG
jgi:hypothetical protein